jgi:hypothetical protein
MKALQRYFFVIAVSVFITAPQLRAAECEALRSAFEKWVAAYANRDLAGTMSIFADDLNFSFQGAPDAKKVDLEKSYRDEFAHPEQSRRWIPKFEEFQCSGILASCVPRGGLSSQALTAGQRSKPRTAAWTFCGYRRTEPGKYSGHSIIPLSRPKNDNAECHLIFAPL